MRRGGWDTDWTFNVSGLITLFTVIETWISYWLIIYNVLITDFLLMYKMSLMLDKTSMWPVTETWSIIIIKLMWCVRVRRVWAVKQQQTVRSGSHSSFCDCFPGREKYSATLHLSIDSHAFIHLTFSWPGASGGPKHYSAVSHPETRPVMRFHPKPTCSMRGKSHLRPLNDWQHVVLP